MTPAWSSWDLWNLIVVAILILGFFAAYKIMAMRDARNMRVALVTLGGLPLLAYGMGSIAYECGHPVAIVRAAFICVVVLLPPSLFFLFIWTRKESLFNQYVASLDRLGLLRKRQLRVARAGARHYPVEDGIRLERRVRSYLDRFSAVYGTLPAATVNRFLSNCSTPPSCSVATGRF